MKLRMEDHKLEIIGNFNDELKALGILALKLHRGNYNYLWGFTLEEPNFIVYYRVPSMMHLEIKDTIRDAGIHFKEIRGSD